MNKKYLFLLGLTAAMSLVYGFVVGKYEVFPYQHLAALKRMVVEPPKPADSFVPSIYYKTKVSYFKANFLPRYDWVFIGDSITERGLWNEFFTDVVIANRGIGGDVTTGVLKRMNTIVNTKADLALLMIGTNDIGWGFEVEDIFNGQKQIIEKLQEANMQVVVQSVIFSDGKVYNNQKISELNERLQRFCMDQGILFLDLNAFLAPNGILLQEFSADGLHLSGLGYKKWQLVLADFLIKNGILR